MVNKSLSLTSEVTQVASIYPIKWTIGQVPTNQVKWISKTTILQTRKNNLKGAHDILILKTNAKSQYNCIAMWINQQLYHAWSSYKLF